jgi:molybdate transport system substrate-binding protein
MMGCGVNATPGKKNLTIFAAASLNEAFGEIAEAFEKENTNVKIRFNFAGSQQLAQQIVQGAQADVFASANIEQMDNIARAGRIDESTRLIFTKNRLILIASPDVKPEARSLASLTQPGIKIVLADKAVPVGKYSLELLQKAEQQGKMGENLQSRVFKNVVSNEQDVKSVVNKVALGEADYGIAYLSDTYGIASTKIIRIDIPDDLNAVAKYPIAVLTESTMSQSAKNFVAFVASSRGQTILRKYGFFG